MMICEFKIPVARKSCRRDNPAGIGGSHEESGKFGFPRDLRNFDFLYE